MKKIVIAGGTGFLGKALINFYKPKVDEIIVFSRKKNYKAGTINYVQWNAKTIDKWYLHLNNADVLINLTGRSVDCRYSQKNKDLIRYSRIDSTHVLGMAMQKVDNPPKIWLNSSTATIYKHSLDVPMSEENGIIGKGFSVSVGKDWEKTFFSFRDLPVRQVALRISIVLGKNGGAFSPIKNLARFGFGGKQGKGNQMFSWIHLYDYLRVIDFTITNNNIKGVLNVAAPNPVTNNTLMKSIRKIIGISFGIPISKMMLKIGAIMIRTESELILKSRYVVPKKLTDSGFVFKHPTIENALENLLNTQPK